MNFLLSTATLSTLLGFSLAQIVRGDVFTNVPEANGYRLVYDLNILNSADYSVNQPAYAVNNSADIANGSFGRVAYYLELDSGSGPQYVYVSMDRLTPYASRIGVPTVATNAIFQSPLSRVNVASNVAGIPTGLGGTGYNIEFWPTDYQQANIRATANASDLIFDWGDRRSVGGTYGSMQIHDNAHSTVLFAYNHWGGTGNSELGIGNHPNPSSNATGPQMDWTFAANAPTYTTKRLQVLVDSTPPAPPPLGTGAPARVYDNAPETKQMMHVYTLPIPQTGNQWNVMGVPYSVDNSTRIQPDSFNRIGYYLELEPLDGSPMMYVYVSADAFTGDPTKIGVPAADTRVMFQQNIQNMNVISNVGGVVNGTMIQTGNIEFWPSNYSAPNARVNGGPVPNASSVTLDFGDGQADLSSGHGSFQIHNYDIDGAGLGIVGQTLLAISDWGGVNPNQNIEVGIGNNPNGSVTNQGQQLDWTFSDNGNQYVARNLYVFAQPVPEPSSMILLIAGVGALGLRRRR